MVVTPAELKQIKEKGYADIGGIKRKKYWLPDGREVLAIPAMRTFIKKRDGKVIGEGVRDANLDNWLPEPPLNPLPHCPHCDKWHDTQAEIKACGERRGKFNKVWEKKAQRMMREESSELANKDAEIAELKSEMADIKQMLKKLTGGK